MSLIPGLPDEIALDCLVRVPLRSHPALKSVCRRWNHLLAHPSFYSLREISGRQESFVILVQALASAQESADPSSPQKGKEDALCPRLAPPVYGLTVYNASAGSWHRMLATPALPCGIPMFCQCAAAPGGKLVVVGGWDPDTLDPVCDVYVCDLARGGAWRRGAPMSTPRSFFACAAVGPAVYVAGGHDGQKNALRSAEVYDVDNDAWIELAPMAEERDECQGLAGGDGRFWVVSGYGTDSQGLFSSAAECYDPERGEWESVDGLWPFPETSPRGSCVEIIGAPEAGPPAAVPSRYMVGPNPDSTLQGLNLRVFDERDKTWKPMVQMPEGISSSPCVSAVRSRPGDREESVFVVGCGRKEIGPPELRACILDRRSRKWTHIDPPCGFSGFVFSASSICL